MPPSFLVGLDLGQAQDYTALSVLRKREAADGAHYDVVHLSRLPLGTSYLAVVPEVRAITERIGLDAVAAVAGLGRPAVIPSVALVVDHTGAGRPVVDLLRGAGLDPIGVTITGGDAITQDGDDYRVPKRFLASTMQILLQGRRLHIAESLAFAPTLQKELENFRVKISLTGHDSYGAGEDWRVGNHDDLVLSVALAAWYGERPSAAVRTYSYLATTDEDEDTDPPRWFGAG